MKVVFSLRNLFFVAILLLSAALNFYQFDKNPPGLYIDEVSIGVNAYSILKTGKDEHGVKFPMYFKSYGEYKLPVYIYLTSVSMLIFGKNEFAVRFPSAFFGTLAILFLYLLTREVLSRDPTFATSAKQKYSLLFILLIAVCPWYLHFVGPAFEATVALFFFIAAAYLHILFKKNHRFSLFGLSLLFFVLSFYTYNSYKVIIPIILFFVTLDLFKNKNRYASKFFFYIVMSFFPLVTIVVSFFLNPSNTRFLQTSAFPSASIDNVILFLKNYLSYFSLDFLFSFGDGINRHQLHNFGVLQRWSLPFLLIGAYTLFKKGKSYLKYATLTVLIIAPIPASLALPSPHTLRSLTFVVAYISLITFGLLFTMARFKKYANLLAFTITLLFIYEFSIYLHFSFFHYPRIALIDWGGSYKQVVQKANQLSDKYPYIAIDESLSAAPEYFRFYNEDFNLLQIKSGWQKEDIPPEKKVLLITSDTSGANPPSQKLIDTVYLPNLNNNIFAQFWEL